MSFRIIGGRKIIVDPAPGVAESMIGFFIAASFFGVVLHQRGLLVLHASAIAKNEAGIAFVGESGRGKSTLAALFHTHSYSLVADDLIGVRLDASGPTIYSGFPQVRLLPDAISALRLSPERLARLHPTWDKRGFMASDGYCTTLLRLKRLYVLSESDTLGSEILPPQQAFLQLMRHSHCKDLIPATGASRHFRHCTALAKTGMVRRLNIPRSFDVIPELVGLVEEDIEDSSNSAAEQKPRSCSAGMELRDAPVASLAG